MESLRRIATTTIRLRNVTPDPIFAFWLAARNCYFQGKVDDLVKNYTPEKGEDMFKKLVNLKHDTVLEHINFQISLEGVSRSFMAQITRHRHVTFHISSQHFQNHSDFLFVMPKFQSSENEQKFLYLMDHINNIYTCMLQNGDPHYVARQILPNAAACKIIMTLNLRELRLILKLRHGPENTPETQDIMKMIISAVKHQYPIFLYGLELKEEK